MNTFQYLPEILKQMLYQAQAMEYILDTPIITLDGAPITPLMILGPTALTVVLMITITRWLIA